MQTVAMEFKEMLQKLKFSDHFDRIILTKEIIANIQHIHRTEVLCILEVLQSSADMEFQAKLLSILSASLLCNNSNRDIIIKWSSLYDTLYIILARGLPMKTAVALNFIATLLYTSDDTGSRNRTLTLHAQSMIRSCGCLTAMTHLFTNHMTHTDTWKALCRCVAEVCRGSEMNQSFCSHLVPLCVQRCLQGNLDVFPVLCSLLQNHNRNTDLFLEADGMSVFERKTLLRVETCLQLLTTVIQNTEVETLRILTKQWKLYENLQGIIKLEGPDSKVGQWARITLFYFESKNKNECKPIITKESIRNTNKENELDMQPCNADDTQMLFHNIMREIISYPNKNEADNPWKRLSKAPVMNTEDIFQKMEYESKNYNRSCFNEEPLRQPNSLCNDQLSFSFLMEEDLKEVKTNVTNIKQRTQHGRTQHRMERSFSKSSRFKKQSDKSEIRDSLISFISCENDIEFKPTFSSTPKIATSHRHSFLLHRTKPVETTSKVIKNRKGCKNKSILMNSKRLPRSPKKPVKQRSMSSRLLDAINESCTTIIKSVKSVFIGNKISKDQRNDSPNVNSNVVPDEEPYCSYSFTKYMVKREAEMERQINNSLSTEMSTRSAINSCKTCDDTLLLKQKLTNDDQLKLTIKKLKLGINLYGCDFKKISKTMWPRESYMTPNILYNLYRKLILK